MSEEGKKLEAVGDGLLLAIARLYLKERHGSVPYSIYHRLIAQMVSNRTLGAIANSEGLHRGQSGAGDAFEREIATRFYCQGFAEVRRWLWLLFDKHMDIAEEARKMLDPDENERLMKIVRGAIRNAFHVEKQSITDRSVEIASKQIVSHLKNNSL